MGTLREHTYETVHRNRKPLKQIAEDVGMSVSYLTRCALPDTEENENGSGCPFPLKKLVPVVRATGDFQMLDHIEHELGRVAIVLPKPNASHPQVYKLTLRAVKEFGELMGNLDESMADGRLTDKERDHVIHEGQEAMQAIVNLLHSLEGMKT